MTCLVNLVNCFTETNELPIIIQTYDDEAQIELQMQYSYMDCTNVPSGSNVAIGITDASSKMSMNDVFAEWMLNADGVYDYAANNCTTLTAQQCSNFKAVYYFYFTENTLQ